MSRHVATHPHFPAGETLPTQLMSVGSSNRRSAIRVFTYQRAAPRDRGAAGAIRIAKINLTQQRPLVKQNPLPRPNSRGGQALRRKIPAAEAFTTGNAPVITPAPGVPMPTSRFDANH